MTTDTAVRVTRMVVETGVGLDAIPFVDHPELRLDRHESTQMPFRYVKGEDGGPVMPEVRKLFTPVGDYLPVIGHVGPHTEGCGEGFWRLAVMRLGILVLFVKHLSPAEAMILTGH
jgi:hypothetical protein